MKPELEEQLRKDFPDLKLPCIECGDGWYQLLHDCFAGVGKLIERARKRFPQLEDEFIVTQVKEKFGTLRVYMSTATEDMLDLIKIAENQSQITCEECGKLGRMSRSHSWLIVSCEECGINDRKTYCCQEDSNP